MKKNNPNLTAEQKLVLFDEGTETPNSSELNMKSAKVAIIVQIVE